MWLFTSNSFVSVVADRDDTQSSRLLVRARIKGDIDQLFPDAEVMETPLADYRYRAWIDRQAVSNAFTKQVEGLTYTNFKNSVKDKERSKASDACLAGNVCPPRGSYKAKLTTP